jgi:hypothetical protein
MKIKLLQIISLSMIAGGIGGAGLTYRDIATESLLHARTGIIVLELGTPVSQKNERFNIYQTGAHTVYLTLRQDRSGFNMRKSALDLLVANPSNQVLLSQRIMLDTALPAPRALLPLTSFIVSEPFEGMWKITAGLTGGTPALDDDSCEVGILPPQRYPIGDYLERQMYWFAGFALIAFTGFLLLFGSGKWQRGKPASTFF